MEDSEKEQAKEKTIELFRDIVISFFEKFKKANFDLMKEEMAKTCTTNLSVVKNITDTDVVCGDGSATLESIINDGNNEIKKVIDSVFITDEELEEMKKSLLDKINFEMSKGEMIFYQKVLEISTAYITINGIANSTKNSLLSALPYLINNDNKK